VQLSYVIVQRVLLTGSLYGLLYYLIFVTTGRRAHAPLLVAYGLLTAFELWDALVARPDRVVVMRWRTDLAGPVAGPAWRLPANAAFLILPPVVASLFFLRIARHAEERS